MMKFKVKLFSRLDVKAATGFPSFQANPRRRGLRRRVFGALQQGQF
jgi:hypothetical protein